MRTLLIANRGEIAIRAARAARELGVTSVAVYAPEDRSALHRLIADRAYEIGKPGHPVRSYLDIDELIAIAREAGADAVYPGYGFLSESAPFAQACLDAGFTFVGPSPQTLSLTGDKVRAREAAMAAGVPVLKASGPIRSVDKGIEAAREVGFPLFIKASAGGGGRGMRRIEGPDGFAGSLESASREAEAAFGDPTVFLEQAITRPRHVEIQVLADAAGEVIHLFERDCSVQRRHQKVVEIAPAPGLPVALLDRLAEHAVTFARSVGYVSAGTVEFLVWADPETAAADHVDGYGYAFIEMNPRIQVEHTVTEEVTGIDLVLAQLQIAAGATLAELGLSQPAERPERTAIQCRLTTEDPADGFRPSTGTILAYRSPGGPGIRLDGATYTGAEISPYYDSLLVKMTTSGADLEQASRRARRGLDEFRVRGVSTNVGFLRALLDDPDFLSGDLTTSFLDEHPYLLEAAQRGPGSGLLTKLAEVTVNRPHGRPARELTDPRALLPTVDKSPTVGTRDILTAEGPEGLARYLRGRVALPVTDTSLRDAHQSLLATRVRTVDLVAAAEATSAMLPSLVSLECWGGATFDASLRFLREDPWDRLVRLRDASPRVALQMLIRGRNLLGYAPYPRPVIGAFVAEAVAAGVDILRVFDALNDIEQMRDVIGATRDAGAYSEGALCYTGDLLDPAETTYTLDYYLGIADDLVNAGVHGLVIKDMAGLLRAPSATALITALRQRFDIPVRLHTHDTAGGQMATYLAAAEAGVDGVDCASAPVASGGSQPAMGALVAAMAHTERDTGLDLGDVLSLEPFWEALRDTYAPFEAGQRSPSTRVYRHEVPGGQLSNLRAQADALGVGDRFDEVLEAYAEANIVLGRPVKVTPSSKVVGDLALWMVTSGVSREELLADGARYDLPASVVAFLHGQLGTPAGGFVQPFTDEVTAARPEPPAPSVDADDLAMLADSDRHDPEQRRAALSRLMLPSEAAGLVASQEEFGDVSVIPTVPFLYGLEPGRVERIEVAPGQTWFVELDAIGDVDETGHRRVHLWANGQPWALRVLDTSATGTREARRRVDPSDPRQIGTTVPGVITISVAPGDEVVAGDRLAVIEAMKMESVVTAPRAGVVQAVHLSTGDQVEAGDLVAEIA